MTDVSISLVGPDQRLALGAANRAAAFAQQAGDAAGDAAAGVVSQLQDLANRAATSATSVVAQASNINALIGQPVATIGRTATPTGGAVPVSGTYTYSFSTPLPYAATVSAVRLFAGAGMTSIALKVFRLINGTWTQIGSDVNLTTTPAAVNNFSVAAGTLPSTIALQVGDLIGWYPEGGSVPNVSAGPLNDPVLVGTSAGNLSSLPSNILRTAQFQIGFDFVSSDAPLTNGLVKQIGATADKLVQMVPQSLGPNTAVTTGPAVSNITIVHNQAALGDGVISTVRAFALSATTLYFRTCRFIEGVMVPIGPVNSVVLTAGSNAIPVSVPIMSGDYVAFYGGTNISGVAVAESIYTAPGNQVTVGSAIGPLGTFNGSTPQVAFDLNYRNFIGAKLQVVTAQQYAAIASPDPLTLYVVQ